MNYYIDFEFLEGTQKETFPISLFRKETLPTIQPISIGIIAEDGREYYAIFKDFNLKEAWNRYDVDKNHTRNYKPKKVYWIRENVLLPIYLEKVHGDMRSHAPFSYSVMKGILKGFGKSSEQIAEEIKDFISQKDLLDANIIDHYDFTSDALKTFEGRMSCVEHNFGSPKFYGYYCDYDWVVFCQLFGSMVDLPNGFPMYCIDLKQMLDEKAIVYDDDNYSQLDIKGKVEYLKTNSKYPKKTNEHNALADAKWNKELHNFLKNV